MTAALVALIVGLGLGTASESEEASAHGDLRSGRASTLVEVLPRPRWVRHEVTPRERLTRIAVRYGVTPEQLAEWNELAGAEADLRTGRRLRIKTTRIPPPRRRTTVVVQPGESWRHIMRRFRVEYRDLRAYNWRVRELRPGTELVVWYDPAFPRTVNVRPGPPVPADVQVEDGGQSRGRPQRGRIKNAVQLPDSELYTIRHPASTWGNTHTLRSLVEGMVRFRRQSGYRGEVVIAAISRRWGGRFPPHQSHQSGRDVDIRLPLMPTVDPTAYPNPDEIDWAASWELVRALADTREVEAIYLEVPLQRRLYQAALWEGMEPDALAGIIQWPSRTGPGQALVRHERGHDTHIHVRFRCGPGERRCRPRRRPR